MPVRNYTDDDFQVFWDVLDKCNPHGNKITKVDAEHLLKSIADPYQDLYLAFISEQLVGLGIIFRSKNAGLNKHHYLLRMLPEMKMQPALLDEMIKRIEIQIYKIAQDFHRPLIIQSFTFMEHTHVIKALEDNCYLLECYSVRMEMTDFSRLQPPHLPWGYSFAPYNPETDLDRIIEITAQLINPIFPKFVHTREEFIRHYYSPWFRPELVPLLMHEGKIKGYAWNYLKDDARPEAINAGYINKIGLVPSLRDRDLKLELLRQAVGILRSEGANLIHLALSDISNREEINQYTQEGFETRNIQFEYYKRED
jgi:ribosomal protein S18 acetylase RimI-like enzyme